jgi:short-subunit dehydrogenase
MQIKDKNIWLIGGSTGIGEALARKLSEKAKTLIISSRDETKLNDLVTSIGSQNVYSEKCDISQENQVQTAFLNIKEKHKRIDTVILNAGIYQPTDIFNFNANEYIKQMNVNYSGNVLVASHIVKHFLENNSGHIVVISSQSAFRALPNAAAYGASKSALTYFFESIRMQLEDKGIKISIIYPGFVKTRLTDKNDFEMPFLMEVDEAAQLIFDVVEKEKGDLGFPLGLALPIQILRLLPEKIYRKIVKKFFMGAPK